MFCNHKIKYTEKDILYKEHSEKVVCPKCKSEITIKYYAR